MLYVGAGGLGMRRRRRSARRSVGSSTASPSTPTPAAVGRGDQRPALARSSPRSRTPREPTVDLVVTVPSDVAGDPDHADPGLPRAQGPGAAPDPGGAARRAPQTVIPVELTKGINDFSVTIVGPGGESDPSPVVRYVLDQAPPKITIYSPKNGAIVNGTAVEINGKTQARTTLLARNAANGSSVSGQRAAADGTFTLSLRDLDRRQRDHDHRHGPGRQRPRSARSSSARLRQADRRRSARPPTGSSGRDLPEAITLTAAVTDPDGKPLAGADITFTLSIPGIPTVTGDVHDRRRGQARRSRRPCP